MRKTDPNIDICHGELNELLLYDCFYDDFDIWQIAREEQFPPSSDYRKSFICGSYCQFLPKVPWLRPRLGGKFKLAEGFNLDEISA
jgi:hypothetical protein